ncbi:MAG: hypothetical protein HYX97_03040 [Chloroflexi bacterium]|nr:hypothetical protein [Chloroflexota bacterium]
MAPRLSNQGPAVSAWSTRTGNDPSTVDVCQNCVDDVLGDPTPEGWLSGDREPQGALFEAPRHPPYDGRNHRCKRCGHPLYARDH